MHRTVCYLYPFYLWVLPEMGLWAQYSSSGYPRIQFQGEKLPGGPPRVGGARYSIMRFVEGGLFSRRVPFTEQATMGFCWRPCTLDGGVKWGCSRRIGSHDACWRPCTPDGCVRWGCSRSVGGHNACWRPCTPDGGVLAG